MLKLEHIGIAVKNLDTSIHLFEQLLNTSCYKIETVDGEKVNTAFFQLADGVKIELLESTANDGVIARYIEKRGEGVHHLAFEAENMEEEIDRLKEKGFEFINEQPKEGADNKQICFLHPKTTNGVLVELCASREK